MRRWMAIVVIAVGVGGFGVGLVAARALQVVAYESGRLHASAEWYRQAVAIDEQLRRGEPVLVEGWRLVPDKRGRSRVVRAVAAH